MEDFDNDGLLDIVVTSFDPTQPMAFYRNKGDGTFEDRSKEAGVTRSARRTGLLPDRLQQRRPPGHLHPARGLATHARFGPRLCGTTATARSPTSPSEAGLLDPVNSISARLGRLRQRRLARPVRRLRAASPTVLYHNRGDGTFEEVAAQGRRRGTGRTLCCKGSAWIDFDNDDYPDLFLNNLGGVGRALSQQSRRHVHGCHGCRWASMGPITGSRAGPGTTTTTAGSTSSPRATTARSRTWSRACWASRTAGIPTDSITTSEARGFEDVTKEAGLDMVFATMGSNYGDFDNDGFLDFYLGTGEPSLATSGPQPHVQERRRQALRGDHRHLAAPAIFRRDMASPAVTGTATATSTCSSRPAGLSTATGITMSCFKIPARGTTG